MNLTDLQVELRLIENKIAALHNEIEKMKPQPEEAQKADFKQITKLAIESPIERRSIKSASTETKKLFFSSLAYIFLQEKMDLYNRLLYLCRLSKGCGLDITSEELYRLGLEFDKYDLNKLVQEISDYKYTYIIEMLIMANISEEASENILLIVTDFASAFEISKEELRVLGIIAKGVLTDNEDLILDMLAPGKNMWGGKLNDYLSKNWIIRQRKECELLCTKKYISLDFDDFDKVLKYLEENADIQMGDEAFVNIPCEIVKRIQTGTIVKKGDTICIYNQKIKKTYSPMTSRLFGSMGGSMGESFQEQKKIIKAPCDGIAFFADIQKPSTVKGKKDEYTAVYVVSYFDDYADFLEWYKQKFNSENK